MELDLDRGQARGDDESMQELGDDLDKESLAVCSTGARWPQRKGVWPREGRSVEQLCPRATVRERALRRVGEPEGWRGERCVGEAGVGGRHGAVAACDAVGHGEQGRRHRYREERPERGKLV